MIIETAKVAEHLFISMITDTRVIRVFRVICCCVIIWVVT